MPNTYTDLRLEISFEGFHFENWFIGEPTILEPRLRDAGYTEISFRHGHKAKDGTILTRRCDAKNKVGRWKHFFYSPETTTKES